LLKTGEAKEASWIMVQTDSSESHLIGTSVEAVGVIIPHDWDDEGRPVVLALSTYTEEMFILDGSTPIDQRLRQLVYRKVRVKGTLHPRPDGNVAIRATDFRPETTVDPPGVAR
jgi:hypothetical protein